MNVLGIKPSMGNTPHLGQFFASHDPGAALLRDDCLAAVAEEERFTRQKHAFNTFPARSVDYVLDEGDITLSDVDVVGIGFDPRLYRKEFWHHPGRFVPTGFTDLFHVQRRIARIFAGYVDWDITIIRRELEDATGQKLSPDTSFVRVPHHGAHAASAAYCSPFDRPITITVDGTGEYDATVVWNRDNERHRTVPSTNSLGTFYNEGVRHLGFRGHRDAGKVMGLASYGEYNEEIASVFENLVSYGGGAYDVREVTGSPGVFEEYLGAKHEYGEPFTSQEEDFAFHLQLTLEEILIDFVEHTVRELEHDQVALAGGVAMNCKLNRELLNQEFVRDLWIQPAANDAGICLGAALEAYRRSTGVVPDVEFERVYLGPSYGSDEIEHTLTESKLAFDRPDSITDMVARMLADGLLVGWFQGRMEYGPRALGHRSILADPRDPASLDRVNRFVKHREPWRPFAPSLLDESRDEFLVNGDEAPFMILLDIVKEDKRDIIPAVTHVDGTTRPHTVREEVSPRYYRLLKAFEEQTGVPVLLNTSFNDSGEPIVENPQQAIRDFYAMGLDVLALGDFVLTKPAIEAEKYA